MTVYNHQYFYFRLVNKKDESVCYAFVMTIDTDFMLDFVSIINEEWKLENSNNVEYFEVLDYHNRKINPTIIFFEKDSKQNIVNQINIQNVHPKKFNCKEYWTNREDILQLFEQGSFINR